jgi:putative transposase
MEAVAGRLTINEIAKRHEVHPVQVSKWKKQFLEAAPGIFDNGNKREDVQTEELTNQLYQQIGQLKVELDWLKKKSARFG